MDVGQLVLLLEPKAGDHVPGRHGKRSAQACGMEAHRAETPAKRAARFTIADPAGCARPKRFLERLMSRYSKDTVYCSI